MPEAGSFGRGIRKASRARSGFNSRRGTKGADGFTKALHALAFKRRNGAGAYANSSWDRGGTEPAGTGTGRETDRGGECGPVTITRADGVVETRPALTDDY